VENVVEDKVFLLFLLLTNAKLHCTFFQVGDVASNHLYTLLKKDSLEQSCKYKNNGYASFHWFVSVTGAWYGGAWPGCWDLPWGGFYLRAGCP